MDTIFPACNTLEDDRFESIEEFKDCIGRGDEIEFEWKGVHFGMSGSSSRAAHTDVASSVLSLEPAGYRTIL